MSSQNGQPEPEAPEVNIEIAGQPYTLCFNWKFFRMYERITGLNCFSNPFDKANGDRIQKMILAALRSKHHPEVTEEFLEDHLTFAQVVRMTKVMGDAWTAALPKAADSDEKKSDAEPEQPMPPPG